MVHVIEDLVPGAAEKLRSWYGHNVQLLFGWAEDSVRYTEEIVLYQLVVSVNDKVQGVRLFSIGDSWELSVDFP